MTTPSRLSTLQRVLLIWLRDDAREQAIRAPLLTVHLCAALCPEGWTRSGIDRALNRLEAQGWIRVHRSPGHQRRAIWITSQGQNALADAKE